MEVVTTYKSDYCQIAHINTKNLTITEFDNKQQQDERYEIYHVTLHRFKTDPEFEE